MGFVELVMFSGLLAFVLIVFQLSRQAKVMRLASPATYEARLRTLAQLLHGTVVLQNSTVGGHLCWMRNGLPYYYYERRAGGRMWTVLSVGIRTKSLPTYQVRPREGAAPDLPALLVRPPLDPKSQFDGRFQVRIGALSPPTLAPSAETCDSLLDLGDLCFPGGPVLEVHETRIRLYLPIVAEKSEQRNRLIHRGVGLIESILREYGGLDLGTTVQFVDALFTDSRGQETCQVCGEPIREERVVCASCATPHHPDCWDYTGVCSVFGCQSKRHR